MAKRQRKTVLAALRSWAMESNVIDEDVLANRFYQCIEEPDPADAVERIKRQMFNRFVASIRKKNIRVAFPVRDKDGITRIHIIPGTRSVDAVARVNERLTRNSQGNNKTRRPVRKYLAELSGQTALDFGRAEGK